MRGFTVRAAVATTFAAALSLFTGAVIEQAAGAHLRVAAWPLLWSGAMVFFGRMAWAGRQWGRVMLAVLAGLTLMLFKVLVFRQPGPVDYSARPGLVTGFALTSAIAQIIGATLAFLPAAGRYFRATREKARLISPRLRKIVLAVHVVGAVSWLGMIAVSAMLVTYAVSTKDYAVTRSAFTGAVLIDNVFLGALAWLVLLTGLTLALGTKWRLTHRRWVVTKFVIMTALAIIPQLFWEDLIRQGYDLSVAGRPLAQVQEQTGVAAILTPISPLLALFAAVISIYKPWGLTRYGRRARVPAANF